MQYLDKRSDPFHPTCYKQFFCFRDLFLSLSLSLSGDQAKKFRQDIPARMSMDPRAEVSGTVQELGLLRACPPNHQEFVAWCF